MTFFSVLRNHFIKKAAKDIKPVPTDIWLEEQRNIAAEFEKKNLKKPISKKKRAITAPKAKTKKKSKPKRRGHGHK